MRLLKTKKSRIESNREKIEHLGWSSQYVRTALAIYDDAVKRDMTPTIAIPWLKIPSETILFHIPLGDKPIIWGVTMDSMFVSVLVAATLVSVELIQRDTRKVTHPHSVGEEGSICIGTSLTTVALAAPRSVIPVAIQSASTVTAPYDEVMLAIARANGGTVPEDVLLAIEKRRRLERAFSLWQ